MTDHTDHFEFYYFQTSSGKHWAAYGGLKETVSGKTTDTHSNLTQHSVLSCIPLLKFNDLFWAHFGLISDGLMFNEKKSEDLDWVKRFELKYLNLGGFPCKKWWLIVSKSA